MKQTNCPACKSHAAPNQQSLNAHMILRHPAYGMDAETRRLAAKLGL